MPAPRRLIFLDDMCSAGSVFIDQFISIYFSVIPRHICSFSVAKTPGPRLLTKKRFVWPHGSRGVRVQDGREAGQPVTGKVAERMLRAHTNLTTSQRPREQTGSVVSL